MSIRNLPVGLFGAVMGTVGLGLTARATATVLPGFLRAPAYFTELWVALGTLVFVIITPLYIVKAIRFADAVKAEFWNPVTLGFCGALPVGMSLVAGGIAPYLPGTGQALWWASFVLLLAFQMFTLYRWLSGGIELAQLNAGWLIVMVGGIVLPGPAFTLGLAEAARFSFGVSATVAPILMALLFYRAMTGAPLPDFLRPSWFILLVPPSLIYANGLLLYPSLRVLEMLFPFALVLAVALLVVSRGFLRWPYSAVWWAFTFPLDALAYAASRYVIDHPQPVWRATAAATLLLAAVFVVIALFKAVFSRDDE